MSEKFDLAEQELADILEKFPEYKLKILHFYTNDEDFKTLCDDYRYCRNFLAECSARRTPLHDLLAKEYNDICLALEKEAERYLRSGEQKCS